MTENKRSSLRNQYWLLAAERFAPIGEKTLLFGNRDYEDTVRLKLAVDDVYTVEKRL